VLDFLADVNVPEEYVSALRGDGHDVVYSRNVPELGPTAADERIIDYAETAELAVLTTDVTDFANRNASVPVFVAPQSMRGGDVRAAVARIESMPLDPAETDPIWLSALC